MSDVIDPWSIPNRVFTKKEDRKRMRNYSRGYYVHAKTDVGREYIGAEAVFYGHGLIRTPDEGAAICYAFGYPDYQSVRALFNIPQDYINYEEHQFGITFAEQMALIQSNATRTPRMVVDIGCGRGVLSAAFWQVDIPCVSIDFSPAAVQVTRETIKEWTGKSGIVRYGHADEILSQTPYQYDTVIFAESAEHIPIDEMWRIFDVVIEQLRKVNGMLIIVNWINNFPIGPDGMGWDHITWVDEDMFGRLESLAERTVFRQGAHLAVQF